MTKWNAILLIIVLVLILIITFGIGWLVTAGNKDSAVDESKYDIRKSKMYQVSAQSIISNLDIGNTRTKAVVRAKPNICVADSKTLKELELRNSEIIDTFISILRSKKLEEMQKPDSKELIKQEMIKSLNESFNTDKILDVFFEEFIVQ